MKQQKAVERTLARRAAALSLGLGLGMACTAVQAAEPGANPYLADSPWPMTHRQPGAPDSSPYPGPNSVAEIGLPQSVYTNFINITLAISPAYPDGSRVFWGSNMADVYKLGFVKGQLRQVARLSKPGSVLSNISTPTSGAYTLVDRDNVFYTVRGTTLLAYRDSTPGVPGSPIALARSYPLPSAKVSSDDAIVGLNLLWDGHLAFVTRKGVAGVIGRDFSGLQTVVLGNGQETVSNSLSTDEQGGIYIVTSKAMYRVQWRDGVLRTDEASGAWSAPYIAGGGGSGGGSLGAGSGSTPTLMGSGDQRFVVITDGADVANLVLFWADAIPAGWQPPVAGASPRMAAQVPVNFGDPNRTATSSQQSVVVSGYGAAVVSNDYRNVDALSTSTGIELIDQISNGGVILLSGTTKVQPWGVQKFEWDKATRQLRSAWVRTDVSCPNAIPVVSEASSRFYCVGAYLGRWTIESLDWASGGGHFRKMLSPLPHYNSFYSSTQLTGDGGIIYGTMDGAIYLPRLAP